jgi:hypothetical protein
VILNIRREVIFIEKRLKIQETKKWEKGRRTERHREEEKKCIRKGFSENQTVEIVKMPPRGNKSRGWILGASGRY